MTVYILAHLVILSLISLPSHSSGPPASGMVLATFRLALPISTKLRQPSSHRHAHRPRAPSRQALIEMIFPGVSRLYQVET